MAAAVTLLGTQVFDTNSGTHTVTATPAVGDLIVILVANTGNTANVAPTDNNSDGNGTYVRVNTCVKATSADTMQMWVRTNKIGSASSTVFTHAPGASSGGGLGIFKITGMSRVGLNAIRQSAIQSNQALGGTPTPALGSAALTTNALIGGVFNATSPATMTPRGTPAYTERFDVGYSTPTTGIETMSINSGETGTSIAWGSTSASAFSSIMAELDVSTPTPPLGKFGNNASGPQLADYGIVAGFALLFAPYPAPVGQVGPAEYQYGTHAQAIYQAEAVKSQVFPSVPTPPAAAAANPLRTIIAGPQQVDLTISGWAIGGAQAPQGPVPPFQFASQDRSQSPGSSVFNPARTTQVAASAVPAFQFSLPQSEDRATRQVWASVVVGQTPPIIKQVFGSPQLYDATLQASVFPAAPAPIVVSYAFKQIWGAPQTVDLTQQAWITQPGPFPQGRVPPAILGAPQPDPTQLAAQVTPSQPSAPIVAGVTVSPVPPTPPQTDLNVNASIAWTPSTFSPGIPPPTTGSNPGFGQGGSGGGSLRCWTHKTHPPSSHRELCTLLDLAFDPQHEDAQDIAVVAKALEIVQPYARPTVDLRALSRDLAAVRALRSLLLETAARDSDEDDDEMFLLS